MHIVLAMNRDAIKHKGFQKWSNEMLEGVKVFPIAQKGLQSGSTNRNFFLFPFLRGISVLLKP